MTSIRNCVALAAMAFGLSSCSLLQPEFETPTVSISSFRAVPSGGLLPDFEIGLRVVNPNPRTLALRGVRYSVTLEGRELVTGVGKDLPAIEPYAEGQFTLTARPSLFEGLALLNELLASPRDSVRYEVSTRLDAGGLWPSIRVRDSGAISLGPSR